MVILLDSSAWVEFFIKSDKGAKVKDVLRRERCYTGIVTISEISNWAMKQNVPHEELIAIVTQATHVLPLNLSIARLAGGLNYKRKKVVKNWGMIDSMILATALTYSLKILTKDSHFGDLDNAEML